MPGVYGVWCTVYGAPCVDGRRHRWEEEGVAVWRSGVPDQQGCLAAFGFRFFLRRGEEERHGMRQQDGAWEAGGQEEWK